MAAIIIIIVYTSTMIPNGRIGGRWCPKSVLSTRHHRPTHRVRESELCGNYELIRCTNLWPRGNQGSQTECGGGGGDNNTDRQKVRPTVNLTHI